jgi:hypothetical protein
LTHDASCPLYAQTDEAEEKIDEQVEKTDGLVEKHAYDL